MNLEPPDSFYLSAASGWLELGNATEARAELERLSPRFREHPAVLEVWWLIHVREKAWTLALDVAEQEIAAPESSPSGWLHRAYALRRVEGGGLEAAWKALLPAAERFPKEPTIPFNLACYSCQLGQLDQARDWLRRAMRVGGVETVRRMALSDPDLAPLHQELRSRPKESEGTAEPGQP